MSSPTPRKFLHTVDFKYSWVETTVSDGRGIYVVRNKPSGGSRAVMVHQLNKSSWVPPSVHLEVSQAGIKKASIYQLKNMIFVQSPEWILAIYISANHRYSCDLSFFWFLLFRLEIFLKVPEKCSVVSPVTNVKTHFWTVVTWQTSRLLLHHHPLHQVCSHTETYHSVKSADIIYLHDVRKI